MNWTITCVGCERKHMIHYRYKCLHCVNYDLCSVCYENKMETRSHKKTHPMQCLLDRAARELFFAGEKIPELCADSFTCPICGKMGHSFKELVKHVYMEHQEDKTPVICPLCVAVPSKEENIMLRNKSIAKHMCLVHGTGILGVGDGPDHGLDFGLGQVANGHSHAYGFGRGHPLGSDSPSQDAGLHLQPSPWEELDRMILNAQRDLGLEEQTVNFDPFNQPLAGQESLRDDFTDLNVFANLDPFNTPLAIQEASSDASDELDVVN